MSEVCQILDLHVHRVSLAETLTRLENFVESGTPHQVATVNMDFIRIARADEEFREAVNQASLAVADGMPVIWLSRLLPRPLVERITGVDIVKQAARIAAARGYGLFMLGAEPGVAVEAANTLVSHNPGLRICGTYAPPIGTFSLEEEARMVGMIQDASPQILFVAFGAPRQDVWIHRHLQELRVPLCVGVGGTLDFLAGRKRRAPDWMQHAGLEWAYRLSLEPRRLWRRYLLGDLPLFLRIVGTQILPLSAYVPNEE